MYPSKADDYRTPARPTATTREIITDVQDDLSDISEDELIEILKQTRTQTTLSKKEKLKN